MNTFNLAPGRLGAIKGQEAEEDVCDWLLSSLKQFEDIPRKMLVLGSSHAVC